MDFIPGVKIEPYDHSKNNIDKYQHTTKWLGHVISKHHAFLPIVRDIANHQRFNEVTTVGIQGKEGSGKSTLARTIVHCLHKELYKITKEANLPADVKMKFELGYCVRFFSEDEDLLNFSETLKKLPRQNRIIVFDDVSFLQGKYSKKSIDAFKKIFTTIRHLDESLDVKTVVVFNYHYSKGFDIYLRDTHYRFYTSISPEESKNITQTVSSQKNRKIVLKFASLYSVFSRSGKITFAFGRYGSKNRRFIKYLYNDPFRIAMVYDNESIRMIVYPQISAISPDGCGMCSSANKEVESVTISPDDVYNFLKEHFAEDYIKKAIRYMAIQRYGVPSNSKDVSLCIEILNRIINNGVVDVDIIMSGLMKNVKSYKYIEKQKKPKRISSELQNEFKKKFGMDSLKPIV